jgi:hypothetical protein
MNYIFIITATIMAGIIIGVIAYALNHEEMFIEKAEKTSNMLNFYHVLALLTSSKYQNYKPTDEEKAAMVDYLEKNANEVHDSHPIGSYFKLCKENDDVCKTAGNFHNHDLQFNGSELAVGGAVMAAFFIGLLFVIL